MVAVVNPREELAKLRMLRGRTAETPEAEREGAFATLAPIRDGKIFVGKFSGESAWERHPNGDELVQILEGAATLHLMTEAGPQSVELTAGTVVVVPRNTWHRFEAPDGVGLMTATPQPTQHLTVSVDDPRTLE